MRFQPTRRGILGTTRILSYGLEAHCEVGWFDDSLLAEAKIEQVSGSRVRRFDSRVPQDADMEQEPTDKTDKDFIYLVNNHISPDLQK